jgi:predicted nucleotidyltransferase
MKFHRVDLPQDKITAFCQKWRVVELALFGSVLRDDFGPDSDIDILISFQPDAPWSLWDLFDIRQELQEMFGREVDLVEKGALRNPFRKHEILHNHEVVYAA